MEITGVSAAKPSQPKATRRGTVQRTRAMIGFMAGLYCIRAIGRQVFHSAPNPRVVLSGARAAVPGRAIVASRRARGADLGVLSCIACRSAADRLLDADLADYIRLSRQEPALPSRVIERYAVPAHGHARATFDVDFLVRRTDRAA